MSEFVAFEVFLGAMSVLCVGTWLLVVGIASVFAGDRVRERFGSRRAGLFTTRATFLLIGIGGAVLIQAVTL